MLALSPFFSPNGRLRWIGSLQLTLPLLLGILSGGLYDKGYFYPLVWTGNALFVFS